MSWESRHPTLHAALAPHLLTCWPAAVPQLCSAEQTLPLTRMTFSQR